jgi:transcriptional regulator with XRE-family HTH domain
MTVGSSIRVARERAQLTQEDLARICGTTKRQVGRWENDDQTPSLDRLLLMGRALGCTVSELIGETAIDRDLSGRWFAAWLTGRGGRPVVDRHELVAHHDGAHLRLDAGGSYAWRGDFYLFDDDLIGHYTAVELGQSSRGAMYFTLDQGGDSARGGWFGRYSDGTGAGLGALARDEQHCDGLLTELIAQPPTSWLHDGKR